jgi:23S rRNA pseudouridine2605 synthase
MHPKHPSKNPSLLRLNRYLSMCGVASRRKADELIENGRVEVNRKVVKDLGTKVNPACDSVFVDGKRVGHIQEHVYLVMNKPKDAITTLSDEKGRNTVMKFVRSKQRVYPIGRLDRNTTGVLLFTNDGEFAHHLMHPRHEVPKSYKVTIDKPIEKAHLRSLRTGVQLEDGMTAPADVVILPGGKKREIGITIHEGRNKQVRRMFEKLGYEVTKLDRVAYGPITKEGLARGEVRSLSQREVRALKAIAGMPDLYEE